MKPGFTHQLFALSLVTLAMAFPLEARGKKAAPTEPGKYEEWKDEIDELEIVKTFSMSDYKKIVIGSFDSSKTELPDKKDNTWEPVKNVLKNVEGPLAEGIIEGELKAKIDVETGDAKGASVLVIEGVVEAMNPGSQAARYWGGFGAGAATTQLTIEIKDGESGEVLLRMTQERRSGVGAFGGDYEGLLKRNISAIGEDIALVLNSF